MALILAVSSIGRWSSQRTTLQSLSKLGPVTETGSSVSWEKTAREQVASKAIPRIVPGLILCWFKIRCTEEQMHRHMSFVDCSYIKDQSFPKRYSHGRVGQRSYVIALLGLPKANVLRG